MIKPWVADIFTVAFFLLSVGATSSLTVLAIQYLASFVFTNLTATMATYSLPNSTGLQQVIALASNAGFIDILKKFLSMRPSA